jgi:crossover junction endodeoxyribonuclease RuvC
MIILGIDPGFALTGYALLKKDDKSKIVSLVDYGCVSTSAQEFFPQRLVVLYSEIKKIIKKHQPNQLAIEDIYFAKNVKTAVKVSQARGIIILAAAQEGKMEIANFTPLQVKQALTGYGRASKQQIQQMVKNILKLKEIPQPDDAADAIAIALTCAQTNNWGQTPKTPSLKSASRKGFRGNF